MHPDIKCDNVHHCHKWTEEERDIIFNKVVESATSQKNPDSHAHLDEVAIDIDGYKGVGLHWRGGGYISTQTFGHHTTWGGNWTGNTPFTIQDKIYTAIECPNLGGIYR